MWGPGRTVASMRMRALARSVFVLAIGAAVAVTMASHAAADSATVHIVGTPQKSAFSPATVTIGVGETVTWLNESPSVHYVAFDGAAPVAVQNNQPYTKTFTAPGTYPYQDTKHPEMTGTVVVLGAATPTPAPTPVPTLAPTPVATVRPTPVPAPVPTAVLTPAPTARATAAPVVAVASPASPSPGPTTLPAPSVALSDGTAGDDPVVALLTPGAATTSHGAPLDGAVLAMIDPGTPSRRIGAALIRQPLGVAAVIPPLVLVLGVAAGSAAFWLYVFGPARARRYWFEFEVPLTGVGQNAWVHGQLAAGCGVSGRSEADCLDLIRGTLAGHTTLPRVRRVVADVDLATLGGDVQRAMGNPSERGVWYPRPRRTMSTTRSFNA